MPSSVTEKSKDSFLLRAPLTLSFASCARWLHSQGGGAGYFGQNRENDSSCHLHMQQHCCAPKCKCAFHLRECLFDSIPDRFCMR
jgi:hypothetical protein